MRKLVLLGTIALLPLALIGQEEPKAEVYGGYSYLRNSGSNFNGWSTQGTANFTPHFGLTADFSGNYRTRGAFSPITGLAFSADQRLYTFLVGPTLRGDFGKFSLFGHGLFGAARSSLGAGITLPLVGGLSRGLTSATAFAMAWGGGLDIGLSRYFAIRAAQVDYLYTRFSPTDALSTGLLTNSLNGHQNSFRYSAGIVFRF